MESFSRKFRLVIFLVSGFPLVLAAIAYLAYQLDVELDNELRILDGRSAKIAALVAEPLAAADHQTVRQLLNAVGLEGDLNAAVVYTREGQMIADVAVEGYAAGLHVPTDRVGPKFDITHIIHNRPIVVGGRSIGGVYLNSDLLPVYGRLIESGLVGLAVITVAFVFAFLLAGRFERRVGSRVSALTALAERTSADPEAALPPVEDGGGELGELVGAVNRLVARAAESNRSLRESQDYFLALVNNTADLILVLDAEERICFVNQAVRAQLGYRPAELVGESLAGLLEGEAREASALLDDWLREARHRTLTVDLRHRDGSSRGFEVRIADRREDPTVNGIVVSCRNITESQVLREEAVWKTQLLDAVFENIPALVYLKDAVEQRYVRVNRALEEFLGRDRDEILGKTDYELFEPDDAARMRAWDEEVLRTPGVVEHHAFECPAAGGKRRVLRKSAVGLILEGPEPRYVLSVAEEVTDRKTLMRELRSSEARYRQVVENAGDAVFIHDDLGRFVDVNTRACESLGYSRDELLSLSVPDVELNFDPENLGRWWSTLESGRAVTLQGLHRRKDGETFPVDVRLSLWDDNGRKRIIALARDQRDAVIAPGGVEQVPARAPNPRAAPRTGELGEAHLLVIQGAGPSRDGLLELLESAGCAVTAVADAEQGAAEASRRHYDLVLVDCQMAGGGGHEVGHELRRAMGSAPVPIVIGMTVGSVEACRDWDCAVDEAVQKPLHLDALRAALRAARARASGSADCRPCAPRRAASGEPNRCPNALAADSLRDLDPATVARLVEVFERDAEERIEAIARDLASGDPEVLRREVHALKSGCLQIGANAMVRCCEALSAAIQERDEGGMLQALARVRVAYAECREQLPRAS